jgi:hypothetical protein
MFRICASLLARSGMNTCIALSQKHFFAGHSSHTKPWTTKIRTHSIVRRGIQVLSWSDHGKLTRSRDRNEGAEGIDYEVILDGEKIFNRGDREIIGGGVPEAQVEQVL